MQLSGSDAEYFAQLFANSPEVNEEMVGDLVRAGNKRAVRLLTAFGRTGFRSACDLVATGFLEPRSAIPVLDLIADADEVSLEYAVEMLPHREDRQSTRFIARLARRLFPSPATAEILTGLITGADDYRCSIGFGEIHNLLLASDPAVRLPARTLLSENVEAVEIALGREGTAARNVLLCCEAFRDSPFLEIVLSVALGDRKMDSGIQVFACECYLAIFDVRSLSLARGLLHGERLIACLARIFEQGDDNERAQIIRLAFGFGLEGDPRLKDIIAATRTGTNGTLLHAITDGEALAQGRWT